MTADHTRFTRALRVKYSRVLQEAEESETNFVRPGLPLRVDSSGAVVFLPAGSIAVQALISQTSRAGVELTGFVQRLRARFHRLEGRTFWQPSGTFHLNVALLRRLAIGALEPNECEQVIETAMDVLDWLEELSGYDVRLRGTIVAKDGGIIVAGYPLDGTPALVRRRFREGGFLDQQDLFHVTVGRLLAPLPPATWRELLQSCQEDLRTRPDIALPVRSAVLICEREGFLHDPSCYQVVRTFRWRPV